MNEGWKRIAYEERITAALDGRRPPSRKEIRDGLRGHPLRRFVFGQWRNRGRR